MKLLVHTSMFCKEWTDDISQYMSHIKKIGFDGVEISLFGADHGDLIRSFENAKANALDIICGTGIGPENDISSTDKEIRLSGISYLKSAVDLAFEAGATMINGVLYAPWGSFAIGENKMERMKRSAECLRVVGQYAKDAGINLNCEVLNRFETDFINTLEEGTAFLKLIGCDNVKLLADIFHMNIEENNIPVALKTNVNSIGCIHICENHRGVPGSGHINWLEIISALKEARYDGNLSMESFVESGTTVGNKLSIWRSFGEKPLSEAQKGFSFIKNIINQGGIYESV